MLQTGHLAHGPWASTAVGWVPRWWLTRNWPGPAACRCRWARAGSACVRLAPNHWGPVNHLGFAVQDLPGLVGRMQAGGVAIPGGVKDADMFRYAMVSGPDGLLLELFEFDPQRTPPPLREFYCV